MTHYYISQFALLFLSLALHGVYAPPPCGGNRTTALCALWIRPFSENADFWESGCGITNVSPSALIANNVEMYDEGYACSGGYTATCCASFGGCALGIDCDVETPIPNYWLTIYPCAVDNASRILNDPIVEYVANNTPYNCLEHCSSLGYLYAGVEYSDECYCGTGIDVTSIQGAPDDECNMPCSGDSTQTCGGSWRMQVYFYG